MKFKIGRPSKQFFQSITFTNSQLHFLLILLFLVPIWSVQYFPTHDGPTHIANAMAILNYFNPEYNVYQDYYVLNHSLAPTWFTHLILAGFLSFLSPVIAEKVFLSAYVILFPLAVNYALRSIRSDVDFLSLFAYPFVFNFLLHMGFYAFCFSLPMFFIVIGFWIRHQENFTLRDTVCFTLLSILLYLFHISVWAWTFAVITLLVIWLTLIDIVHGRQKANLKWVNVWVAFKSRGLVPLYACLPVLVMIAAFLVDKQFLSTDGDQQGFARFRSLLQIYSLVSYDTLEVYFARSLSLLFAFVVGYLILTKLFFRQFNRWDGLFFVFIAFISLYMLTPETKVFTPNGMGGGGFMDQRLNLFPYFALVLWFAAQKYSPSMKKGIQIFVLSISLGLIVVHTVKNAEFDRYIVDYLSGMALIEPNSTVLGLVFAPRGPIEDGEETSMRISIFRHTVGYIAAERQSVSFTNYEANHGYFPLIYREDRNPYTHIAVGDGNIERPLSVELEFLTYTERTGGRLDYVLLWGLSEAQLENENVKSILSQLEKGYEIIHRSPLKLMTIYKLKEF